jgi:hypothetical protein
MMEKAMAQGAYESGAAPPQASSGYRPAPAAAYARPLAPNGPPVDDPYGEQGAPPALVECGQCGRKMTAKALGAHSKACGKVRKVFDAKAARVGGTEAAEFVLGRKAKEAEARAKAAADAAAKKSKWKEQSSAFRDAMKNARCDWRVCTRKRATVAACTREPPPSKRGGGYFQQAAPCASLLFLRARLFHAPGRSLHRHSDCGWDRAARERQPFVVLHLFSACMLFIYKRRLYLNRF